MKFTEEKLQQIIKEEIQEVLLEVELGAMNRGNVRNLVTKAQRDPHKQAAIRRVVQKIISRNEEALEEISENPAAIAQFITTLMTTLGLNLTTFMQISFWGGKTEVR